VRQERIKARESNQSKTVAMSCLIVSMGIPPLVKFFKAQ